MVRQRTVLIVGAGGKRAYGFPLGYAFWEREPGADDDLLMPKPPARAIIAPMLLYMR